MDKKEGKITAKIFSFENALEEFSDIHMIRIKSSEYNIMIMEDYLPLLGEVKGDVTIIFGDDTREYKGITGYYMHRKNQFYLLINEDAYVRKTV